jgi:hypothetical protein
MRVGRGLWCASVVLLSSGCGLFSAQADAPAPSSTPATGSTAAATAPSTPTATAAADLTGSVDGRAARLSATVGRTVQGAPPLDSPDGTAAGTCGLRDDSTEYELVTVVFTVPDPASKGTGVSSNLRLDLSVPDGDGVFVGELDPATDCRGGALPSRTALETQNLAEEHQTEQVYVVAPTGGLHGVTLQLRDPRHYGDTMDDRTWTWTISSVIAGTTCDGDANSLCVPLA